MTRQKIADLIYYAAAGHARARGYRLGDGPKRFASTRRYPQAPRSSAENSQEHVQCLLIEQLQRLAVAANSLQSLNLRR